MVQVAFGSQAVEGKLAMLPRAAGGGGLAPEAIAMARMLGAAAFFQALQFVLPERPRDRVRADEVHGAAPPRLGLRDHGWLIALALLGITINQTLFLMGLRMTTALSASLLAVAIPVFTALLAVAFRHERGSARLWIGFALALAGALRLTGVRAIDRGAVLVLVNSISYSLYLVLGRAVIQRLGAFVVMRWIFTWGAIVFLPVGLWPLVQALTTMTPLATALLAYIIVVPTIVAYLANAWALGRSSATLVTIYIYMQPLIAAALAYLQLGQPVSSNAAVAGVLILMGVTLVATRRRSDAS